MDSKTEKILRLVQEGKMSPEDADNILGLLKNKEQKTDPKACHLKININKSDNEDDKVVNLNLPISFIKLMVKATGKFSLDMVGKNESVRQSLETSGLSFDDNGKITDIDAFVSALEALCESAPVEVCNIQTSDDDIDVSIRISIE